MPKQTQTQTKTHLICRRIKVACIDSNERKNDFWRIVHFLRKNLHKVSNQVVNKLTLYDFVIEDVNERSEELQATKTQVAQRIADELSKPKKAQDKDLLKTLRQEARKTISDGEKKIREQLYSQAYFSKSEGNISYQLFSEFFAQMPIAHLAKGWSHVFNACQQRVYKKIKDDRFEVRIGKRTRVNFKPNMPIYFREDAILHLRQDKGMYCFDWLGYPMRMILGGKEKDASSLVAVNRAIRGEYRIKGSSFSYNEEKKELYLNLVLEIPKRNTLLDKAICVGVDLGINVPAVCALNEGHSRKFISNKEQFFGKRQMIQRIRKEVQKKCKQAKGGRGRKRKLKALKRFKKMEKNFAKRMNHLISNQVVKFALRNNAGTIKMEFLQGIGQEDKNRFVLRNWGYYQLQSFIRYKAELHGIQVLTIDPYHTSQQCSACGHDAPFQRDKLIFTCHSCGVKLHADYNGARNIAKSEKVVTSAEQTTMYKIKHKAHEEESESEAPVLESNWK